MEKRKRLKEQKENAKEERKQKALEMGEDAEKEINDDSELEEEEEPLPPIYIPPTPCNILSGFYSEPGNFWVSLVSKDIIKSSLFQSSSVFLTAILSNTLLLSYFLEKILFISHC